MAAQEPHTLSPMQHAPSSSSPPGSGASSPSSVTKKRSRSPMSIDLSSIPPLSTPAPPSNTLLITRLDDSKIFHAASLATIRQHINDIAHLHSFAPLKSMHRIICSFYDIDSAVKVRQAIDGSAFVGHVVAKCYFGEPTPVGDEKKYLERPDAGRLFFISPPPSPPVGWESKQEDPPNKDVHADDLAAKLSKLTGRMESSGSDDEASPSDYSPVAKKQEQFTAEELQKLKIHSNSKPLLPALSEAQSPSQSTPIRTRSRSSTIIYDPKAHGDSPALPAVMLETEDDSDVELDRPSKKLIAHTSRPPVELME